MNQSINQPLVKAIQSFVDEIVQLDYSDAIQAIKQENEFSASKKIQTWYNETVYWEIIRKGADLLDPKSLPTPKGPLDEFTMAEKVATKRYMLQVASRQTRKDTIYHPTFEKRKSVVVQRKVDSYSF
jgi:hypothetical protein